MYKTNGSQKRKLAALRMKAFYIQNGKCFWCGVKMILFEENHPHGVSADHHPIPHYLGGKIVAENIVAACRTCNSKRLSKVE